MPAADDKEIADDGHSHLIIKILNFFHYYYY